MILWPNVVPVKAFWIQRIELLNFKPEILNLEGINVAMQIKSSERNAARITVSC